MLLTGASGHIGRTFYEARRGSYRFVLSDLETPDYAVDPPDRFVRADLSVPGEANGLTRDADVVVHLAAEADELAGFDRLLPANVLATTYLFEAAARSRPERFVFASSVQVYDGYAAEQPLRADLPVRPTNLYGVTKCYGEALCACYAAENGLSCIAVRIGDFEPYGSAKIRDSFDCSAWVSPDDVVQLITRSIDAVDVDFFIAHGVSNNRVMRLDLEETRRVLGYQPVDDAFEEFRLAAETPISSGRSARAAPT